MNSADFEDEILRTLDADVRVERVGETQRFSTNGKRGDTAGWLVFFETAGAFGDWRTGETYTWHEQREGMTPAERAELRRKVEKAKAAAMQARAQEYLAARRKAWNIWQQGRPVNVHPYLVAKQVLPYGIREHAGLLIIPLVDETGGLWTIRTIDRNGRKRFLPGGKTRGEFHLMSPLL